MRGSESEGDQVVGCERESGVEEREREGCEREGESVGCEKERESGVGGTVWDVREWDL